MENFTFEDSGAPRSFRTLSSYVKWKAVEKARKSFQITAKSGPLKGRSTTGSKKRTKPQDSDKVREVPPLPVSQKRKEYLKKRKEKLSQKNKRSDFGDTENDERKLKDNVKFGDVVQAPPIISVKPKPVLRSHDVDERRRNQLGMLDRVNRDKMRSHAIAQYRLLKQAKLNHSQK